MKAISAALCAFLLGAGAANEATSPTILDGTYNGTFSCPKYQGTTDALVTFITAGWKTKAILTLYYSKNSKYGFATSIVAYDGYFNPTKRIFTLAGPYNLGDEPRGWTYDSTLQGSITADGSTVTINGDSACTPVTAKRVAEGTVLLR